MSHNPNTIKSQDADSIHITNVTDRTESTIELIEKIEKLSKQLEIAKDFIKFIVRYDCKVVVPKDFSKYEACWFFIKSLAQEKLEQIKELNNDVSAKE